MYNGGNFNVFKFCSGKYSLYKHHHKCLDIFHVSLDVDQYKLAKILNNIVQATSNTDTEIQCALDPVVENDPVVEDDPVVDVKVTKFC
jgi:hypothetical protein